MAIDLSITVNGIRFPNPFLIGSGPPSTNRIVMAKAFDAGWGGAVAKTISLESHKVTNVSPRYGKLVAMDTGETIGFENIELISDRPLENWLRDFRELKKAYPDHILIASLMEEVEKPRWQELARRVEETGVDALELNFSCPHGMPERRMGAAIGQHPDVTAEITGWVTESVGIPVWAKMTPNLADITEPAMAAVNAGAQGISAINTILSIIGIDLRTLRPKPTVEGHSIPGGYSGQAVRPIALRHVMELGRTLPAEVSLSGMGGVERGADAIEFLLLGASTVQVCTGVMLRGIRMVTEMREALATFLESHGFASVGEMVGKSLPYFTTHADLVERQQTARGVGSNRDDDWGKEAIEQQTSEHVSE